MIFIIFQKILFTEFEFRRMIKLLQDINNFYLKQMFAYKVVIFNKILFTI